MGPVPRFGFFVRLHGKLVLLKVRRGSDLFLSLLSPRGNSLPSGVAHFLFARSDLWLRGRSPYCTFVDILEQEAAYVQKQIAGAKREGVFCCCADSWRRDCAETTVKAEGDRNTLGASSGLPPPPPPPPSTFCMLWQHDSASVACPKLCYP